MQYISYEFVKYNDFVIYGDAGTSAEAYANANGIMFEVIYTGLVNRRSEWLYVRDGRRDDTYTGIVQNEHGWWYIRNGKVDFTYTGITSNENGKWNVVNRKVTARAN